MVRLGARLPRRNCHQMDLNMKHLSLCTGIGGLDLAAEWAGFETIAQCEIDEYASMVLAKNFRGVPNLHDIRTVTNERLAEFGIDRREITVISAGFPCQPYSLAGKGRGDRDERDLWGEVARVVGEIRPKWFVGENTPGLFARSNQRYFRRVLDDLAALGYSVGWGIWGACDVGAPHRRDRVFIMAHADGIGRDIFRTENRELSTALGKSETKTSLRAGGLCRNPRGGADFSGNFLYADGVGRGANKTSEQRACTALDQKRRGNEPCGTDSASRGISYSNSAGQQERRVQRISSVQPAQVCSLISNADGIWEQQPQGEQQESGERACDGGILRQWWEAEPDVGRVAYGVSARVDRHRCLGNAVVPQQAYPIFEAIADYEKSVSRARKTRPIPGNGNERNISCGAGKPRRKGY